MVHRLTCLIRRIGSALIDNFLLFFVTYLASILLFPDTFIFGDREWSEEQGVAFAYRHYYFIACWWVYYAVLERCSYQSTWGKQINGFVVTDLHGNRIGLLRATVRHAARVVTLLTCLLGYLTILFTKRRQALHDLLSGTMVIQLAPAAEDELIEQDYEDSPEPVT